MGDEQESECESNCCSHGNSENQSNERVHCQKDDWFCAIAISLIPTGKEGMIECETVNDSSMNTSDNGEKQKPEEVLMITVTDAVVDPCCKRNDVVLEFDSFYRCGRTFFKH